MITKEEGLEFTILVSTTKDSYLRHEHEWGLQGCKSWEEDNLLVIKHMALQLVYCMVLSLYSKPCHPFHLS